MSLSHVLEAQATYPFVRLDEAKARLAAQGIEILDFGMGEPREPTPAFIRQALVDGLGELSAYPRAVGLPELKEAIHGWIGRRFGVHVGEQEIVPTLGSKEAIFSFAQVALGEKRIVAIPEPCYPVYERGAQFAAAEPVFVPLREENGFLPDLGAVDFWDRIGIFWVNYPNNPTGAVAPRELYEELAARAAEHGFWVCSDEAYSELWFDDPPSSALQAADRSRVVVFNTLSKRSSMAGYRSGFVCAPAEVADALRKFRPTVGTAPQEFVQLAAAAAWRDEVHVEEVRVVYARKRETMLAALADAGLRVAASRATFFLWVEAPPDVPDRLLERGVVVAPGDFFGPTGAGYFRLALVPPQDACERAAAIVRDVLA